MSSKQSEIITEQTCVTKFRYGVPVDAVHTSNTRCTMGIATGNWGCGAFGGDVELKTLLQWIAASQVYFWTVLHFFFWHST